jgi:hypothetical protein
MQGFQKLEVVATGSPRRNCAASNTFNTLDQPSFVIPVSMPGSLVAVTINSNNSRFGITS